MASRGGSSLWPPKIRTFNDYVIIANIEYASLSATSGHDDVVTMTLSATSGHDEPSQIY